MKLIVTKDGSHTLYHEDLDETYHSVYGARQESQHVFVTNGFGYLLNRHLKNITILEVGFGTGLNAYLTLREAKKLGIKIIYVALEPNPIPQSIVSRLNYSDKDNAPSHLIFTALHEAPWGKCTALEDNFILLKIKDKLEDYHPRGKKFNLVYFDAFAYRKQPEIWSLENLSKVCSCMEKKGIFVTYASTGQLRRDLITLGFEVEKLPGPPGKREIIRAMTL